MLSGDNGILKKATDARERTDAEQIRERIHLAELAAVASGKGDLTEPNLKSALTQEFGTEGTGFKLKDNETSWEVEIIEKGLTETIAKTSNSQAQPETDPATEYGYANKEGIVEASTLKPGDLINYYYDANKAPIECVVLYGSDSENGLQVVSLNSVRKVALGYSDDDTTARDKKAIEVFADKNNDGEEDAPEGYTVSNFEKARWSYNNAITTLNGYAQDYLGDMAISARCVGTPVDGTETTDMFTANASYTYFKDYNGLFKGSDSNVNFNVTGSNANADLNTMHQLGIIKTQNASDYWLASRIVGSGSSNSSFLVRHVGIAGDLYATYGLCSVDSSSTREDGYLNGFRPIFVLKSNIQIEKIVDSENFEGAGGFSSGDIG